MQKLYASREDLLIFPVKCSFSCTLRYTFPHIPFLPLLLNVFTSFMFVHLLKYKKLKVFYSNFCFGFNFLLLDHLSAVFLLALLLRLFPGWTIVKIYCLKSWMSNIMSKGWKVTSSKRSLIINHEKKGCPSLDPTLWFVNSFKGKNFKDSH